MMGSVHVRGFAYHSRTTMHGYLNRGYCNINAGYGRSMSNVADDALPSDVDEHETAASFVPIEDPFDDVIKPHRTPEAIKAKSDLLALASSTKRGFSASQNQRKEAKKLCETLTKYNPTLEPAYPFYLGEDKVDTSDVTFSLSGKWTLVYTDAPDITGLDGGPLATAKLGRIGQECAPPFIKNVIEWKRPTWAGNIPFSGTDDARVLQKVCIEAMANPKNPRIVDLKLVGLDLLGFGGSLIEERAESDSMRGSIIQSPGEFFEKNPVELRGILKAPFGRFEVLFLDEDMRIIKTSQGFLAVNVRDEEEWF